MALITIRDDGTWDYGTPGEADHFLGDHDSCRVVLLSRFEEVAQELDREAKGCATNHGEYWLGRSYGAQNAASLIRKAGEQ